MNKLEFDVHSLLSFSWSIESRNQRNLQILHILPSGLILKLPPVKLLNFPNSSISRHSGENPPVPQWGKSVQCHNGENPSSDTEGKWIKLSKRFNIPEPPLWLQYYHTQYLSITTIITCTDTVTDSLSWLRLVNFTNPLAVLFINGITFKWGLGTCLGYLMHTVQRALHSWYWKILPLPWCWKPCSCPT